MKAFLHTIVARLHGFLRSPNLDSDFNQELEQHLAMAAEDKIRRGMTPEEAYRAARAELGGLTQLREAGRAARGLPWLDSFGLDVRLALRMMRKSWGLTLIGGLAMAVAIGIGATAFAVVHAYGGDTLPIDEGDRVVRLQSRTRNSSATSVQDFEWWRQQMQSVKDISAFATVERILNADDGSSGSVTVAQMTSSGFRVARVRPLVGRTLLDEDERDGATPVMVIGYDIWQSRFAGDRGVIGQKVRLGGVEYVVVGVMQPDFAFPVNHHVWIPLGGLEGNPLSDARPKSANVIVFGRLAPGATIERAQAELEVIGATPEERANQEVRVRVARYADSFRGGLIVGTGVVWLEAIPVLLALLLVPPAANIAILIYARNVTRQEEFAARYVLGASRSRIVGQLLIEAFVLAAAAAAVGLLAAQQLLRRFQPEIGLNFPFWVKPNVSVPTVLYVAALAAFAALVAGGLPALRATGGMRRSGFHGLGKRASSQLGITWTALVVLQVALSTAVLPAAGGAIWTQLQPSVIRRDFAAQQYVTAKIAFDDERPSGTPAGANAQSATRFRDLQEELVRQVTTRIGVSGATVSAAIDGIDEPIRWIETDNAGQKPLFAGANQVDDAYLDVFEASLLAGRSFEPADFKPGRAVVMVNRTLAEQISGQNPLGRRLRYLGPGGRPSESKSWFEIVGLVDEIAANTARPRIYHPISNQQLMAPDPIRRVSLTLRLGPTVPSDFARRLLQITTAVDAHLQVEQIRRLDDVYEQEFREDNTMGLAMATIVIIVLLFAAAGVHTLVAFAVAQRRREIGIRSALGAPPMRLVAEIFRRDLFPVVAGAIVGALLAFPIDKLLPVNSCDVTARSVSMAFMFMFMVAVGLLAVAGPARRLLRIDSTDALRDS